ncbi:pyridoxal phosphate-dependent decarboxylase family protein [Vreelandella subglaciescola]|uniref:Glutamate or tyrosine decarboxylase n=1 Tax=Vreelandella subglaciescola TaxID=29571 RepID=A0A1M7GV94_9GAMM|nr:pyridoxal-dependent decarboxylase [Halomonas subglaciescola]SHM20201.1 Glutamate or tyrosine decarboxylase [Halomonas subglaciescola]
MTPAVSLDPDDWDALDSAFRQALRAGFDHLQSLDDQPVWQPAPESVKANFRAPLPREPKSLESLLVRFRDDLLPYSNGNTHPSFFGWVHGGGNLYGALGELCAALLNNNLGGRDHIAHHVEHQVLQWSRELFGYTASSTGLLTSGTSMATVIALSVARQAAAGPEMKTQGLQGRSAPLVGYCSAQSHNSILKAFQLLGLGSEALRAVPVNDDFTLNTRALEQAIAADRAAGVQPFCVIATVGTVNTGAIDDIATVQALCQRETLWLHVDAAFGGAAALLDEYRDAFAGVGQADSLAFDFHKWFQVPYAVGGLLVKDGAAHQATFSERKEYLTTDAQGLAAGAPWFCDFGPELSRGFLALKVWFTLQGLGSERLAAVVRKHCRLARVTAEHVDASPTLERLAPVPMNIVCLRHVPPDLHGTEGEQSAYLAALNRAIVTQLQIQGLAAPSTTTLDGQLAIRVAIVNHRTEMPHMEKLIDDIETLGKRINSRFAALLNPAHWHLMQGGDARLIVNPDTGLNRYGCSPSPREAAFTFASSTATSISTTAYQATDAYRQRLLHDCIQADSLAPLATHCRTLEQELAAVLGLADLAPDVHLSPSGTDAQLHTVAALTTAQPGRWISIVCGADETGSGTPFSVTGCHFDDTTCLGHRVTKGERLAGMAPIEFAGIAFRDASGRLRSLEELDDAIEARVHEAIEQGERVMLHAMDQSKFGCWAPSPARLEQLRHRYGERLQVIIDACQLRLDADDLRDHVAKGDILLLTGSKFFTGPPFSGAAVFPEALARRLQQSERPLPSGLTDYLPQADTGAWQAQLPGAPAPLTIGMYLRWYAALAEIKRYYQVPKATRINALEHFGREVMALIDAHPHVEALFQPASPWWARTGMHGDELSSRRSIFAFLIRDAEGHCLEQAQVKALYEQLNRNASDTPGLTADERTLAAQCCHIGQPVKIDGKRTSALRISMGARIIADGQHNTNHLEEELRQVRTVLEKITLCLRVQS